MYVHYQYYNDPMVAYNEFVVTYKRITDVRYTPTLRMHFYNKEQHKRLSFHDRDHWQIMGVLLDHSGLGVAAFWHSFDSRYGNLWEDTKDIQFLLASAEMFLFTLISEPVEEARSIFYERPKAGVVTDRKLSNYHRPRSPPPR
ncbi:hypothetical protein H4R34_002871 [Dimargaris verticillata]|uniref:PARP catalytic domain-containing protein n=1 Tax=Dimargaris verticillata TaxID=2761393 RepID=A0A9W8ECI7_9FUNG|nr:hypothetical protein H4R34_002871 [Dimargaris verticillata]